MSKDQVNQFDATAGNNTDIEGINTSETMVPSAVNNSIRSLMSLLKKQDVGTHAMTSPDIDGGTIDGTVIGGAVRAAGHFSAIALGTASPTVQLDVRGTSHMITGANWNYSGLNLIRTSTNTTTPRMLGMMLDGDSATNTTVGAFNSIWGFYSGIPTTGSTSAALAGQMVYGAHSGHQFYVNGSAKMALTSAGLCGLGTTAPAALLHLKDSSIVVGNGTAGNNALIGRIGFSTDSSNSRFIGMESYRGGDAANGDLRFHTFGGDSNSGERFRITAAGNVGIGTTAPATKLQVSGTLGVKSNSQTVPTPDDGAVPTFVVSGNLSNGGGEQNLWSTNTSLSAGFRFSQVTGSGAYEDILYLQKDLTRFYSDNSVRMSISSAGEILVSKYNGTAASPTESSDWPTPVMALRSYDASHPGISMLSFGYPNDAQYQTGNAVWNFRLWGTAGPTASSAATDLTLSGPGDLALGSGGVETMRLVGANVGIGTTSPSTYANGLAPVLVVGTGNNFATIQGRTDGPSGQANGVSFGGSYGTKPINFARIRLNAQGSAGQIGLIAFETKALENDTSQPIVRMTVATDGTVNVVGTFTAGTKTFRIDHPLPAKTDTHYLLHSSIEGPQADLIYRGRADLVSGTVDVNIDTAAGMTEGTFEVLCADVQCFTSNEDGWTALKGAVTGNVLTITAQDNTCTDTVSWMVIGERKDAKMIESEWADNDGKLIVETLKSEHEYILEG